MIYFRLGRLQNSKAVSNWVSCYVSWQNKKRLLLFKLWFSLYSIYNVVQMSDEILRVLRCSNILIYNILYWQIKARQTIKWNY
jgi:hypothetical protein